MPGFVATVKHWQQQAGLDAGKTLLAGFSQGAIMALESTQAEPMLARRVVAMAGRYAVPPTRKPAATIHLLHGSADPVMPAALAQEACEQVMRLGGDATLDLVPGVGHEPHPALLARLAARLP
jgi:phospholipase/carboxylesterase